MGLMDCESELIMFFFYDFVYCFFVGFCYYIVYLGGKLLFKCLYLYQLF